MKKFVIIYVMIACMCSAEPHIPKEASAFKHLSNPPHNDKNDNLEKYYMRWGLRYCLLYYDNTDIEKLERMEKLCPAISYHLNHHATQDDPKVEARIDLELGVIKQYVDTQITTMKRQGIPSILDGCLDMYESKTYEEQIVRIMRDCKHIRNEVAKGNYDYEEGACQELVK
ncbi:hypothetical protein CQA53_10800 [Helicobacter didelphidarum]|uniref:Uncharacterized protein n=1 Tax=Helicobacter didelphidarum TaxID=2040648 RepID=A0A3D8I622_9HELI|nr:hypothetical protein [Helicobacter didelphidarum]RDU60602.1 hypothetical protein CQA53_10800 [Helicobacter didelphidarum]